MTDQPESPPKGDVDKVPASPQAPASPLSKRRRFAFESVGGAEEPAEEWMLSYSDMVTLLLTMFIALLLNADFTKTVRGGDDAGGGGRGALSGATRPGSGGGEEGVEGTGRAGEGKGSGAGGAGHGTDGGGGMGRTLQDWFQLKVSSPYTDANGYVLALRGPEGVKSLPPDADLAVVKDQDLAQIAYRERTLAGIRGKLVEARVDAYVTAEIEGDGIRLNIPNSILFATGSAEFQSEGLGVISAIVSILSEDNFTISVEGHTDNAPIQTDKYPSNWELSAQRAATVVRTMIGSGIEAKRLEAVGYADTHPLATNETVDGRAQNRRVALFIRL